jgi:cell division septal protein FtsQ
MEIKTNKPKDVRSPRVVPPPDKARPRKKASQKLGNGHVSGHRAAAVLRFLGKLGTIVLLAAFMLSVFVHAFSSDKFNLRNIRINGCKQIDKEQIQEIIHREFPANLLRIDLPQVKQRLEKETWAKQVELRRILPSDLIVDITERIPAATLEMNGELMVADEEGILLGKYDAQLGKLDVPVFKGILGDEPETYQLYQEENTARIQQGMRMMSEITSGSPQYSKIISEVDISDRNNLKFLLVDDTAEVYIGNKDYLARFQKFVNNPNEYQKLKTEYNQIDVIDLRFDHKIVYIPKQAQALASNGKTAKLEDQRHKNR